MKNNVFISYSHKIDKKLARAIHDAFHRLAKPWNKRRALNVFMDETEMSANANLLGHLRAEIMESEFFLLLASPESAASEWVKAEIEFWLKNKPAENIIIALTKGAIVWDSQTADFDWNETTALPFVLKKQFLGIPNFADFRDIRLDENLSLDNLEFKLLVVSLAAKIHHKSVSDLIGYDMIQHRRTMRIRNWGIGILSGLLVLSILTTVWALNQTKIANQQTAYAIEQKKIAEENEEKAISKEKEAIASNLAVQARRVVNDNKDYILGLRLAQAAYNSTPEPVDEAKETLLNIMNEIIVHPMNSVILYENKLELSPNKDVQIRVSPDGKLMGIVSNHNLIEIWDTEKFEIIRGDLTFLAYSIEGFTFSPDNKGYMVFLGHNAYFKGINYQDTLIELGPFRDKNRVYHGNYYSSDKTFLVRNWGGAIVQLTSNGDTATVWNKRPSKYLTRTQAFSNKLNFVVRAYSESGAVIQFPHKTIDLPQIGEVLQIAISNQDQLIATGGYEIKIWNSTNGKFLFDLKGFDGYITSLDFSNDNKRLVASTSERKVYVWDLEKRTQIYFIENFDEFVDFAGFGYSNQSVITKTRGNKIQFWKLEEYNQMIKAKAFLGAGTLAKISEDGNKLIIRSYTSGLSSIYQFDKDKLIFIPSRELTFANGVELSNDSRYAVFTDNSTGLSIFDLDSIKLIKHFKTSENNKECIFSADGKFLFTANGYDGVQKWDWQDEELIMNFLAGKNVDIASIACTPDGAKIIGGSGSGVIYIWDVNSGKLLHQIKKQKSYILDIDVSKEGDYMISGSADHTLVLWDTENFEHIKVLKGHEDQVKCVDFSPDNKWIASGGDDKTVRVWDRNSGTELFTLRQHLESVKSVAFHPNDGNIYSMGFDSNLITWTINADVFNPDNYYQLTREEKIEYNIPEEMVDNLKYYK